MNLATDPWLPVIDKNNTRKQISLNELFQQPNEWTDLVLRPHERVSVMRFLTCLTQAALDRPDDWDDAIRLIPESALAYLKKWEDHFDLYNPQKPFLQINDLEQVNKEPTTLDKLDTALATGSNSTLFDHQAIGATNNTPNRELTDDRIVISMLAFNNFSLGGLYPQAKWKTKTTSKAGVKDAPCASQSMLHCYVRKSTLVETIYANVLTKEQIVERYGVDGIGKPVWEMLATNLTRDSY
jgi:CRISPR system Cascade subunit CasA